MKKIIYILIITISVGCRNDTSSNTISESDAVFNQPNTKQKSKVDTTNQFNRSDKCNCDTTNLPHFIHADLNLNYHKSRLNKKDQDSIKHYTSSDSLIKSVKSLRVNTLNIPKELSVFKNVEQIYLSQNSLSDTILNGITSFTKLNSIILWGANLSFKNIASKAPNLKRLRLSKSKVSNFQAIQHLSGLNSIFMFHSAFDSLPSSWNNLRCLKQLHINSYNGGKLDLQNINLQEMPCIEEVEFNTIVNNVTGIPKGVGVNKEVKIKIRHPKLTDKEKQVVETNH